MRISTVVVLAVLGLLVVMYLRAQKAANTPFTNPNTTPTQAQSGTQQIAGVEVFKRVMDSLDTAYNRTVDAIQTSPNSV